MINNKTLGEISLSASGLACVVALLNFGTGCAGRALMDRVGSYKDPKDDSKKGETANNLFLSTSVMGVFISVYLAFAFGRQSCVPVSAPVPEKLPTEDEAFTIAKHVGIFIAFVMLCVQFSYVTTVYDNVSVWVKPGGSETGASQTERDEERQTATNIDTLVIFMFVVGILIFILYIVAFGLDEKQRHDLYSYSTSFFKRPAFSSTGKQQQGREIEMVNLEGGLSSLSGGFSGMSGVGSGVSNGFTNALSGGGSAVSDNMSAFFNY